MRGFYFLLIFGFFVSLSAEGAGVADCIGGVLHSGLSALAVGTLEDRIRAYNQNDAEAWFLAAGFESKADYLKQVERSGSEGKRLAQLMENENDLEIVTSHPDYLRDSIAEHGFLNAHQTGKDVMGTSPHGARTRSEALRLGFSEEEYKKFAATEKPRYAIVRPAQGLGVKSAPGGMYIGEDHYILKDEVRDLATVAIGDSNAAELNGKPHWYERFLPWKARSLAIPFICPEFRERGSLSVMPATANDYIEWFKNARDAATMAGIFEKMRFRKEIQGDYVEVQIYQKDLSLNDVKVFEYENEPPSGAFLEALKSRGIIIRKVAPTN